MIEIKLRTLIDSCIEDGIRLGIRRAHKHTDSPGDEQLLTAIQEAIWLQLDEFMGIQDDDDEGENQEAWGK